MGCCQSTDAAVELKANTSPVDAPSKEEAPIKAAEEPAPPAAKVEKAKEPEPGKEAAPTGAAADKEEAPTPPAPPPRQKTVTDIKVPPTWNRGQSLKLKLSDGRQVQVEVPPEVAAGDTFKWTVPPAQPSAAAKPAEETPKPPAPPQRQATVTDIKVPPTWNRGQSLKLKLSDGRQVHVEVPPEVAAGETFKWTVPPAAKAAAPPPEPEATKPAPVDEEYDAAVKAASTDLAASAVQSGIQDAMKAQAEEEAAAAPAAAPEPAPAPATLKKQPSLLERAGTWLFGTPEKSTAETVPEEEEVAPSAAAAAAAAAASAKGEEPEVDAAVSAMVSRAVNTARDEAAAEEADEKVGEGQRGRRLSAETVAWLETQGGDWGKVEKPQEQNDAAAKLQAARRGSAARKELDTQQEAAIKVQAIARGTSGRKAAAEIVDAKDADEASKAAARARVAKAAAAAPTAPVALVAFAVAADGRVLTSTTAYDAAGRDAPPKRGFLETLGASMKSLFDPDPAAKEAEEARAKAEAEAKAAAEAEAAAKAEAEAAAKAEAEAAAKAEAEAAAKAAAPGDEGGIGSALKALGSSLRGLFRDEAKEKATLLAEAEAKVQAEKVYEQDDEDFNPRWSRGRLSSTSL